MEKLHPGARWVFRLHALILVVILSIFIGWFVVPVLVILFTILLGDPSSLFVPIILGLFLYLILIVLLVEIYARMSYNRWFYEFNKEGLKLERGIIWKRYSNVPYSRIQNVDVHRGILARMIGFSSVMIQTAGFSGPYGRAEGNLPAVSMEGAEKIRDFLMKKITSRRKG
jgi:membrane protein YdbS with pleckstrin-like domain